MPTPSRCCATASAATAGGRRSARRRRLTTVAVRDQGDARVALVPSHTVRVVARRGERLRVRLRNVPDHVEGPLRAGSREGTADVLRRGRVVARAALVTARAVPAPTTVERMRAWLGRTLTIVLLGALAVCTVQLVLLRRRTLRRRRRRGAREAELT